jgi:amino acid adenylation domain-containing protein
LSALQKLSRPTDTEDSFAGRFEGVAETCRSRTAIISDTWQPTYAELNVTANRLAHALLARQRTPGGRIAILMQHDSPLVAAVLAVLKAGNVVVGLHAADPIDHLRRIMDHVEPDLLVTDALHRELATEIAGAACAVLDFADHATGGPAHNPQLQIEPDLTAILAYSSGTTGRPNAVMLTHRRLVENNALHSRGLGIGPEDRIAQFGAMNTGLGIHTSLLALLNGAALCPFSLREKGFGDLAEWLVESGITVTSQAASTFRHFIGSLNDAQQFPHLRIVRISGEPGTWEDFAAFRRHFPPGCMFAHCFGLTELGIIAQLSLSHGDMVAKGRLPAGRPYEGIEIAIEDEEGNEVGPNETGQIVVRGRALAAGYWRDASLTAARFSPGPPGSGVRVFRGGDLGRFNAEGLLEFVGRRDEQVKVRGFRVMLTDVEDAVRQMPAVQNAAVCALEQPDGDVRLVAYVVPDRSISTSSEALRRALRAKMPDHMVPSSFVLLDRLPLTVTGKIDRTKLRHTDWPDGGKGLKESSSRASATPSRSEPSNNIQETLLDLWREVLNRPDIGTDDDFFLCGGDSLSAIDLVQRIEKRLRYRLPLTILTEAPTVTQLEARLKMVKPGAVGNDNMMRVHVTGRRRPLFVVHGLFGPAWGLLAALRSLGPDQPGYGLQPPGMDWHSAGLTTLRQIAAHCIGELKTVQPHGPYRLLGSSFGGLVVFEMALQLQKTGETVEYLGIVDSAPPRCLSGDGDGAWKENTAELPPPADSLDPLVLKYATHLPIQDNYVLDGPPEQNVFRGELTYFCCTGNPIVARGDRRHRWPQFASRFRLFQLNGGHDVAYHRGPSQTAFEDLLRATLNGEPRLESAPENVFGRAYRIEHREHGELLIGSMGDHYRVAQSHIHGHVDEVRVEADTIHFKGWAADLSGQQSVQTIAVFLDGRFLGYGTTGDARSDVAKYLAADSILYCGFNFEFRGGAAGGAAVKPRLFLLLSDGRAAELRLSALNRWPSARPFIQTYRLVVEWPRRLAASLTSPRGSL